MSDIEHEGKLLNIDVTQATDAIIKAGGKPVGEYSFRRYVFDVIPANKNIWVRLRTNGTETTLTVKEITHDGIDGTLEWEVTVSDFDTALTILKKCGLEPRGHQENRRTEYSLNGVQVCIDYWPKLRPYLEIEGEHKEAVEHTAERLGFKASDLVGDNTMKLYAAQGIDLNAVSELKF